jgi:hypothetical protein
MFSKTLNPNRSDSLIANIRRQRLNLLLGFLISQKSPIRLLDIGGTESFWKVAGFPFKNLDLKITLLNLTAQEVSLPGIVSVIGDACHMPQYKEGNFDLVFSNSVIEHVGTFADQESMAKEIQRICKRYFIQTPNRHFPIEPHFAFPFFQYLPVSLRVWLIMHFSLGWFKRIHDKTHARQIVNGIRLLNRQELKFLFPNAEIFEERFWGLTNSYVVYAGWN